MKQTLTKRAMVELLSQKTILSKKQVEQFLHYFLAIIEEALKEGSKVTLPPFGSFCVQQRAPHNGRHPKTGARIPIAGCRVPAFHPGKMLLKSLEP